MSRSLRRSGRIGLLGLLLLLAEGCQSSAIQPEYPETTSFAASLGVDISQMLKTPNGVYYKIKVAGVGGRVDPGSRISADFKAWLPDGRSIGTGHFNVAMIELLNGLIEGITGMQKGEVRLMAIPSQLAYGPVPPDGSIIPANSVLVYEITLLELTLAGA